MAPFQGYELRKGKLEYFFVYCIQSLYFSQSFKVLLYKESKDLAKAFKAISLTTG